MNTIPAISISQPFAWAIINKIKGIENRDYAPMRFGRSYRGRVLIHAPLRGDSQWYIKYGKHDFLIALWAQYLESKGLSIDTGKRLVYIGESSGGCTGDDAFFEALERDWEEVATHRPVQWWGIHDWIEVYQRKGA